MFKAIGGLLAAVLAVIFVCGAGLTMFFGGPAAGCALPAVAFSVDPAAMASPPAGGWQPIGEWDADQVANAATIISVGASLGVPPRGQVIAVAVAIQESNLHNLPGGDRDSLGLFQQRPSHGWGSPAQIMNPLYAATKFYQKLLSVPHWPTMTLADAAQSAQHSADRRVYAQHEGQATALVGSLNALTGVFDPSTAPIDCTGDLGAVQALPPGFTLPPDTPPTVITAITWALAQLGTPYHLGGDCTAAHSGIAVRQCDCSSLVILSPRLVHGRDLRDCVEDSDLNAAGVDTMRPRSAGWIVAKLRSFSLRALRPWAGGSEVPR